MSLSDKGAPVRGMPAPEKMLYHLQKPVFLVGQGYWTSFDLYSSLP
jgi:hypothetical protein